MNTNIDEHLDEVLGVINMPKKEITKVEKIVHNFKWNLVNLRGNFSFLEKEK